MNRLFIENKLKYLRKKVNMWVYNLIWWVFFNDLGSCRIFFCFLYFKVDLVNYEFFGIRIFNIVKFGKINNVLVNLWFI